MTKRTTLTSRLILVAIIVLALVLRLYGLAWDRGYLFHPDERQILVIVDEVAFPWPPDVDLLLSPESPWNPGFFAYGSLPIYLLRLLADVAGRFDAAYATLESSYVVGRGLSALFDVGTIVLIYLLGRKLYDEWVGVLAAGLVAVTVLHIQLAHFYAVDTLLTFFVVLTVLLVVPVVRSLRLGLALPLGLVWGMALASKISALPLGLPILLGWVTGWQVQRQHAGNAASWRPGLRAFLGLALTGVVGVMSFVLFQPYAVIDVVTFVVDVIHESYMARGVADIPYTRQFIGTTPYLYPLWQMMLWSLGLPLGIAGVLGALAAIADAARALGRRHWERAGLLLAPLSWVLVYFAIVGGFHAKFLRYMLPIIPFLCLWAAWGLLALARWQGATALRRLLRPLGYIALTLVVLGTTLYAAAYMNVYREDHPWLQATNWLCTHLDPSSRIMVEHWDDPLPLRQGTGDLRCARHHIVSTFPAYEADTAAKLELLLGELQRNDYIVLSSNRLYNTIPRLPERYPLTSRYYELLMAEALGYELVAYAAVYPGLGDVYLVNDTFANPDLPRPDLLARREAQRRALNLGRADESFTVYDHPKPLIFAKKHQMSREDLLAVFGDVVDDLPQAEDD